MESMSKVNNDCLKEVANLQQVIVKPFYVDSSKEAYYNIKRNLFKENAPTISVYTCGFRM